MLVIKHFRRNLYFDNLCLEMGGSHNLELDCFEFSAFMQDELEKIKKEFGGDSSDDRVVVDVTANSYLNYDSPVDFFGYPLVEDGRLFPGVYKISGTIDSDPNAFKNQVSDGTTFRLRVSKTILDHVKFNLNRDDEPSFSYKIYQVTGDE